MEDDMNNAPMEIIKYALKTEAVLFEVEKDIAIVTLNIQSTYNAVNQDLLDGLNEAITKVREDNNFRAMVLTGAGRGFSSGADLADFGTLEPEEGCDYIKNAYTLLMRNLITLKKPVIAAVNGTAAGFGASIALACDFRVMSEKSALLYAFINIGLGPDGGASWLLSRQIGYSKALEIALDGEKIYGVECHKLGLTNKLVGQESLLKEAKNWAHRLAKRPTLAVGITKEDMFFAMDHDLYSTIAYEAEKQITAFKSADLVEGVSAFMQKRTPKFIGK
jgi:enoyl-CoA hydratase/carnithine racemase